MELKDRIIAYLEKHHPITDAKILALAKSKGYTDAEVYAALELVHTDKRISTKARGDVIWYDIYVAPPPKPVPTHTQWLAANYPWPEHFEMPFPEIDLSWIFLKTKAERDEFRAMMNGGWQSKRARSKAKYSRNLKRTA